MNTQRFRRLAAATLLATSAGFTGFAVGCEEGPAEEAGEAVDDAVEDTGDAIDDAVDNP
jgi:hypothetical protein